MSTRVRGYVIEGHVARGGMGDVHRARVEATGEEVALKVMRAASTFDDEAATRERFVREARVLAGLSHPCIVRYVAHGTTLDGQPFVAAEWIEGETLADRIARKRVTPRDAAALGASLADALATSHEAGVVHRDLKPTNIMIAKDGRPKLIDFGVAKSASPALTLDGAIVGSHGYMSPEQLRGGFAVGPAADAYGLGCVMFRALTGRTPFEGVSEGERLARMLLEDAPDVRDARPDVPEELALLVASMLRAEADERPSMRVLAKELARIARVMESVAPPAMREDALSRKEQSIVSVVYVAATSPDAPTNAIESDDGTLDEVRGVLAERGARIEKLPNGALAAVFGPRAALGEQLHAAASAALEAWRIAPEHPIALTTGRVEITGRSAFGDAIGRAVTLAREGASSIATDEASASLLASRFVVAPSRRGAPDRRMYSLVAQRSAPEAARTVRGRVVPLFGRDAELATLLEAWRECLAQNRGTAALVVGGAGAGKTRLAAEVVARIRGGLPRAPLRSYSDAPPQSSPERSLSGEKVFGREQSDNAGTGADAHVVVARADPLGSGAPYALARAIAASVVDSDLPPPSSRAPRSQPPLGPFIAHLLGRADAYADDEGLRAARVDPALMRDRLREAFASVVGKAFGSRPLLFLIEDLQWADAASVRLLAEIAARATRPLLVLALARPEIDEGAPPFGAGALALRLDALSEDAARALARTVAGEAASPESIERIVRLGDGNAFFVEELARVASSGTETMPSSVMAVTQARLGALPAYARQVLRAASLLRPWIARDALVDMLGTSAQTGDLDATLDDLVAREVLVRAEGGFVFRHELLAEAAYASLTEEDAQRGHLAAAALLVARGASDPRLVAEHLERGGDRAGAAKAFARAAKAALDGDDAKAALASAERATALGADGEALGLALAVQTAIERWRGDLRRAVASGTQALGLLDRASARWLETTADVGASAGSAGDTKALEEVAAQMLAAADATSWASGEAAAWAVRAFASVAVSLVRTGDVARAEPLLARAEAMRKELATDHAIADIGLANARAARRNFGGDPLAYLETMPLVVENATHLRDGRTACLARAHLGYGWAAVGAWKEAGAALRSALEEATRSKLAAARASALHNLALVLEADGDREASARMQTEALEASIEQRATRLATACRLDLALLLLRADRAREALEQARLGAESAVEAPLRASADAVVSLAHAALGESREALARAEAAKTAYERMGGVGEHDPVVHLAWARALARAGGDARGAAIFARERLLARAATIGDPRLRASFLDAVPVNAETLRLAAG